MAWRKSSVRVRSAPRPHHPIHGPRMISPQAEQLWDAFRQAPKQIDLALEARRQAGEQAEGPTSEPAGVQVEPEPRSTGCGSRRRRGATGRRSSTSSGAGTCSARRRRGGRPPGTWRTPPTHACCSRTTGSHPRASSRAPSSTWSPPTSSCCHRDVAPERTIVAGDSSGGGLALALLLALRGATFRCRPARWRCRRGPTSRAKARR